MLIQGSVNTQRTNLIIKKYNDLILKGIPYRDILVIVLNSYKKKSFIEELKKINKDCETKNIFTFAGLCYNAFLDNRDKISVLINNQDKDYKPNLCGLEISQFIFKQSIKEADFSDYISKVNLLHQLFRRYSLIVQNCLTDKEIQKCSSILNESFGDDAKKAIDSYKLKTIKYNSFDYLRQLAILPFIYNETDYFKNIKYLLVDDADEFSYAFWNFVYVLMPGLKDFVIGYDNNGSSRCGYLCAYKAGVNNFISKFKPQIAGLNDKSVFAKTAGNLYQAVINGNKVKLENIPNNHYIKRLDMLEAAAVYISGLLNRGIQPKEIAVITPLADNMLFEALKDYNISFQNISGSEKLMDYDTVKHIIYVLKILNNIPLKNYELKNILINLLKIPCRKCIEIINFYNKTRNIKEFKFEGYEHDYAYNKLLSLKKALNITENSISEQIKTIFSNLIKEFEVNIQTEKYAFLLKEAENFETAFNNIENDITTEFIKQIENSVISENPAETFCLNKKAVIISTPQKIIDFSIKTKYQLWLDISSSDWQKQDTGTLYNAWVFSKDWQKNEYSLDDNINLTRDKTARIIRKLLLCSTQETVFYSSIYDNSGNENFHGLDDFIENSNNKGYKFEIIPREDQKPVLKYKNGKMGIMAVPGAGKTTILLALIIKLIKDGIKPENIFVLTYMEAAAKNFKERLKLCTDHNSPLPNISTIHGLALRIIKENGNYSKIGLDENFDIIDDSAKERIIKELFYKLKIDEENYDNYLRCISIVKLAANKDNLYSKHKEINSFLNFYKEYNSILKQNNFIDYDDMLCYAVKILEENREILKYYQNLCRYIIEDEAQDSTQIQQRLINLINGKYNNLVRCGDINQAITSTFTNSSLESFRNFVKQNKKVEMVSSQRCSKPIYETANKLIELSYLKEECKNAFYNIKIKGTENNPDNKNKPVYKTFEKDIDEKNFILLKIREILKTSPDSSVAVLLRLNSQVTDYNNFFINNGIKTIIRSDLLCQMKTFNLISEMLKIIQNPFDNKQISALIKAYEINNIYKITEEEKNFIKDLKTAFINLNTDEITFEGLLQLYWDIDYWLNNSTIEPDILALRIGLYYSNNNTDKSNTYLISTIIKRLNTDSESFDELLKKLEYISQKPAYKLFEDDSGNKNKEPAVNIMTMHKSKGDEFDYVFIPELNEENYPLSIENTRLKSGSHFVQTIKNLTDNTGLKSTAELKTEQIEETLRLLYVGITRAKYELYLTNSKNYLKRKNTKQIDLIENII